MKPEITENQNWDAIVSDKTILIVAPGSSPECIIYDESHAYLIRESSIEHLVESEALVAELQKAKNIILVEADEWTYRISEISCIMAGSSG